MSCLAQLGNAQSVTTGSASHRFDIACPTNLGEEARERIFAPRSVARGTEEGVPVAVVDCLAGSDFASEHGNGDLSKALPAEFTIEILDLQLRRKPEDTLELLQRVLVSAGLSFEMIS